MIYIVTWIYILTTLPRGGGARQKKRSTQLSLGCADAHYLSMPCARICVSLCGPCKAGVAT